MKDIKPFIDLGWYTVPLKGTIDRLEDGSKTIPRFEKDWKNVYAKTFNYMASALGGVLTGAGSNIIAIDCDNQATFDLFMSQVPNYQFVFVSKGKPSGGGTLIFKYDADLDIQQFSIHDNMISLDFYTNDGFIYLPSDANATKEPWGYLDYSELPKLATIPTGIKLLLTTLYAQYSLAKNGSKDQAKPIPSSALNYLNPQVTLFCTHGFDKAHSLFKIITPRDFRDLPQYVKDGFLHPKDIPEGRGSEYLSKVSAILGADPSIDSQLYYSAMRNINDLWSEPMDIKRLEATIIARMVEGQASIDGEPIWQYDEHWESHGLAFVNKLGEAIEVFFDDLRQSYYLINYTLNKITTFIKDADMYSYIEAVGNHMPSRKELKQALPLVRTIHNPGMPFGFFQKNEYVKEFNLFRQTPALAIINNPETYEEQYTRPHTTIRYLESLIPDKDVRLYVLQFIKHKLKHFNYSPIVLYFLGAPGSGKDTFVEILAGILGNHYIAKPSAKEFLEPYNGWLLDAYFVQLDEYGNQLTRPNEKAEALGKIKALSGKAQVQIRKMRTDGFSYSHNATIIMSANLNPILIEEEDRRIVLIETPLPLAKNDWVALEGGVATVHDKIISEINDLCYYIATEIPDMNPNAYVTPPSSLVKRATIAEKLDAGQKIVYLLKNCMFAELEELAYEHNVDSLFEHVNVGYFTEDTLYDLYAAMTDGYGQKRALAKFMRDGRFIKSPTTKQGQKTYVYKIDGLVYFTPNTFDAQ